MAHEYDKIVKENILPSITTLLKKALGVEIAHFEVVFPELTYTVEKDADFILLATDKTGNKKLYHIEFQVKNDTTMLTRMLVYYALLYYHYQVPVKQVLFFMGNVKPSMSYELPLDRGVYSYDIHNLRDFSYYEFLASNVPEVVLMALLADFHGEKKEDVVTTILEKLRSITRSDLALMRYVKQAQMLGQLRSLRSIITNLSKNMLAEIFEPLPIEEEMSYLIGESKGKAEGKAEGEAKKLNEMVQAMFAQKINLDLIATIANLPLPTIQAMYQQWQNK